MEHGAKYSLSELLELKGDRLTRLVFLQTSRDHSGFTLKEACDFAHEECPIVDRLLTQAC